jgi:hypothetical protein
MKIKVSKHNKKGTWKNKVSREEKAIWEESKGTFQGTLKRNTSSFTAESKCHTLPL